MYVPYVRHDHTKTVSIRKTLNRHPDSETIRKEMSDIRLEFEIN